VLAIVLMPVVGSDSEAQGTGAVGTVRDVVVIVLDSLRIVYGTAATPYSLEKSTLSAHPAGSNFSAGG